MLIQLFLTWFNVGFLRLKIFIETVREMVIVAQVNRLYTTRDVLPVFSKNAKKKKRSVQTFWMYLIYTVVLLWDFFFTTTYVAMLSSLSFQDNSFYTVISPNFFFNSFHTFLTQFMCTLHSFYTVQQHCYIPCYWTV